MKYSSSGHTEHGIGDNIRMPKLDIRQVLAANIERFNQSSDNQLSIKAGISKSHLSEIMRGLSVPTIDVVAKLADALGRMPWELLADSEETRRRALERLLYNPNVAAPDSEVEKHLPPSPKKVAATRRRKRGTPEGPNPEGAE